MIASRVLWRSGAVVALLLQLAAAGRVEAGLVVLDFDSIVPTNPFTTVPSPYGEDGFTLRNFNEFAPGLDLPFGMFGPADPGFTGHGKDILRRHLDGEEFPESHRLPEPVPSCRRVLPQCMSKGGSSLMGNLAASFSSTSMPNPGLSNKPDPNDMDVFMLMNDNFDASHLSSGESLLFDHAAAQAHFGASVFWLRRLAAWEGEQATIEYWQVKRGGGRRGVVEIIPETS